MNIVVLVKEVPDMERVQFDRERGVINRASAEAEINPFDRNALQAAVNIRQQLARGGKACTITALTMGPSKAEKTLRDVYARGADRCVLLTDRKFGGADTLATSHTLAAAVRSLKAYDLILCGEKTVDGDTAQVGPEVAEFLEIPHCCYVEKIECGSDAVEVTTAELCGSGQVRRMEYPALISVTKNIAAPTLPTLKRKLESLQADITVRSFSDISSWVEEARIGGKGSPTRVAKIEIPREEVRESKAYDTYGEFAPVFQKIARELAEWSK